MEEGVTFLVGLTSDMAAEQAAELSTVLVAKNRLSIAPPISSHLKSTIVDYHETNN